MLGKNPLWVADQHGHRIATMLSVYAAWIQGARECDIAAIRRAMGYENDPRPAPPPMRNDASLWEGALSGNFLTGIGAESDRLTIRIRVDAVALDVADWKGESPARNESDVRPTGNRMNSTGSKLASKKTAKSAKPLKGLRKTGGADGTRMRRLRLRHQ